MLDVNDETWSPRIYNYTLNGRSLRFPFYAAYQGYPRYTIFYQPYSKPGTSLRLVYNRLQEAVRQSAERLNAVSWSRSFIIKSPARYMTLPRLINTSKAVAILHNMAVEHRRHGLIASTRKAAAEAVRGARSGRHDGDVRDTSGDRTAFVKDDRQTCGSSCGEPVLVSGAHSEEGRCREGAPVGTTR